MKKHTNNNTLLIFFLPILRTLLFFLGGLFIVTIYPFRGINLVEASKWWAVVVININLITLIILFLLIKNNSMKFKDLISSNKHKKTFQYLYTIFIMLLLGVGGLWGFSYLFYGYIPLTNTQPLPVCVAILVLIFLPITTVLSELPLYLGYCAPIIKKQTNNAFIAISYPLFFYALQHSFIPLIFDIKHMLSRFLMFVPLLVMIGIYYYKQKEILSLMIGHGVLDAITGLQLLVVSVNPSIYETMNSSIQK